MNMWDAVKRIAQNAHYTAGTEGVEYVRSILFGENPEAVLSAQEQYEYEVQRVYEDEVLIPQLTASAIQLLELYGRFDHIEERTTEAIAKLKDGDAEEAIDVLKLISELHTDGANENQGDEDWFDYHSRIYREIDEVVEGFATLR